MEAKELTSEEMSEKMKENMKINAKERPWGWEWKFLTALYLLNEPVVDRKGRKGMRSIQAVKKMLGLTYPTMLRWKLITFHPTQGYRVAVHE